MSTRDILKKIRKDCSSPSPDAETIRKNDRDFDMASWKSREAVHWIRCHFPQDVLRETPRPHDEADNLGMS